MDNSKKTLKALIFGIVLYAVLFMVLGFFLTDNLISYFLGLLLGSGIAGGLALHLYKSLDYCLELEPDSAEKLMKKKALFRYFIMLAAIGLAFCFPNIFNPLGLFAGIMALKISAYIQPFIYRWYS